METTRLSTAPTDLSRARLSGHRSQQAFRVLLDTLARPGTVRSADAVQLPPGVPTALLLPLALADVEVSVAVVSGEPDQRWAPFVRDVTGCRAAPIESASIVVLLDGYSPSDVLAVRRGTALAPESGARLAIACRTLRSGAAAADEAGVRLSGPGVDGRAELAIGGVDRELLDAIATANASFPAGIDTWLVSRDGHVAAIPRSSRIETEVH